MGATFRFSPRPNRAADIRWRDWGADAFAEAGAHDKPILLCLTAVWCHWCRQMDETTYSNADLIDFFNEHFIPIRVDADQYPHVQERYITGGWPTNAFLAPTGEVLWSGTYIEAEQFAAVAEGVRSAWADRRAEFALEIERRRKALDAARGRVNAVGIVRREGADDVWSATVEGFDARNGGFGTEPKYPAAEAVELAFLRADEEPNAKTIAAQTLDGMVAGELWDTEEFGFFRYALAADWTRPQYEKLLAVNASQLRAYALGARLAGRADWQQVAERIVEYVEANLALDNGLWASSQAADPEYYTLPLAERKSRAAPSVDSTVYTSSNAQWVRALADAGGRLQRADWIARAERGMNVLLREMSAPNGLFYHFRTERGEPEVSFLLFDDVEVARAHVSLAQATGNPEYLQKARQLVSTIEHVFWATDGGFYDRTRSTHDVGALRYQERPFDLNSDLARLLIELLLATGERSYRALAERTLAVLSPLAGRYGVAGSNFAIAVDEFFEPPLQVFIVGAGEQVSALRSAALALPVAGLRVWPLPGGGRIGTHTFQPRADAAAYVVGQGVSAAITDPSALAHAASAQS